MTDLSMRKNQHKPPPAVEFARSSGALGAEGLPGTWTHYLWPGGLGRGARPVASLLFSRTAWDWDCEDAGRLPARPLGCWTHAQAPIHGGQPQALGSGPQDLKLLGWTRDWPFLQGPWVPADSLAPSHLRGSGGHSPHSGMRANVTLMPDSGLGERHTVSPWAALISPTSAFRNLP